MRFVSTHRRLLALVAAGGTTLALAAAAPADAHQTTPQVVAKGLDSPRHLAVSDGRVYVVEAGRGGTGPCAPHPELPGTFCFGFTGAVTRVDPWGPEKRVITGLASISSGEDALGPSDIVFRGNTWVLSSGLGADPAYRNKFGAGGPLLATLLTGRLGHRGFRVFADVGANEALNNPDGTDHDSNPTGILRVGDSWYVADAGGNAIVKVSPWGTFSTVAALPPALTTKPSPAGPPAGFPADAVPTEVVKGPDGALYVSQLTGFPFEQGLSSIWRIAPGGQPQKWATGLTNVTDIAFGPGGRLYAVQIADKGLADPGGPIGSLVRVTPHGSSHTTIAGGLFAPYGVAFMDGSAYVSTCSVCTGGGEVLRVRL
jgi:hypothetical protein